MTGVLYSFVCFVQVLRTFFKLKVWAEVEQFANKFLNNAELFISHTVKKKKRKLCDRYSKGWGKSKKAANTIHFCQL